MTKWSGRTICVAAMSLSLLATGCHVENHKDGESDNVKIATPFGGMSVKTNDAAIQSNVGLAAYPGATVVKQDHDHGSADVSLNFGSFHLGVKAVSYRTPDDAEKVLAFYRKDMAKYGNVILCKGNQPVGTPTRTQDGLSCNNDSNNHVHTDESGNAGELKAGSKQHQHIVSVDREAAGSKFGLVALDLPGHLDGDGKDDKSE